MTMCASASTAAWIPCRPPSSWPNWRSFDQEVAARQKVAQRYSEALKAVVTPYVAPECTSVWAQYSVLSDDRADLQEKLKEAGIPTAVYYPLPLHLQGAFAHLGHQAGRFSRQRRRPPASSACPCILIWKPIQNYIIKAF